MFAKFPFVVGVEMRQYKMIAIDLDGTLLDTSGQVSPRSRSAVQAALSAGLLVCFATGRNWTESKHVLDAVAHYDCAVFVGGAMVVDTKNEVVLHRMLMGSELARELCAFLEARGQCVLALQDTTVTGVDYLVSANIAMNAATKLWMDLARAKVQPEANLATYPHEQTVRVGVVAPPAESQAVMRELQETFAARIVAHSIGVPSYNVEITEVFDPAVNKWQGILHVAARHGVKPEEIIAIGDDVNDLPMLRNAGLSVAMGNAHPDAKALAKIIIGTNHEDGLAVFLEEVVSHHRVKPLREFEN
jgi:Cof subfamily protein (haloacid dehalogenase superfamily)